MSAQVYKRFLISGRVQGVFYRASAAREAERLGVSGYARNLADGRVEVLATGSAEQVAALAEWLADGPKLARVDSVAEASIAPADWDCPAGFATY